MVSKKIQEIRKGAGLSQKEFAEKIGVSYGTLQSYEYGNTSPTFDTLKRVSTIFKIPMYFFIDDSELINKNLTPHPQNLSEGIAPSFQEAKSSTVTYYPNVTASAGYGNINDNEECIDIDTNLLNVIKLPQSKLDMIQVQGDSMHPYINNGDFALIERSNEAKNGDIVIANFQGDLYVKQLQKNPQNRSISLISSNKDYPSFELKDEELESLCIVGILRAIIRVY